MIDLQYSIAALMQNPTSNMNSGETGHTSLLPYLFV